MAFALDLSARVSHIGDTITPNQTPSIIKYGDQPFAVEAVGGQLHDGFPFRGGFRRQDGLNGDSTEYSHGGQHVSLQGNWTLKEDISAKQD